MIAPLPKEPTAAECVAALLPNAELDEAYRRAKADESDEGQAAAGVFGREIVKRLSSL